MQDRDYNLIDNPRDPVYLNPDHLLVAPLAKLESIMNGLDRLIAENKNNGNRLEIFNKLTDIIKNTGISFNISTSPEITSDGMRFPKDLEDNCWLVAKYYIHRETGLDLDIIEKNQSIRQCVKDWVKNEKSSGGSYGYAVGTMAGL